MTAAAGRWTWCCSIVLTEVLLSLLAAMGRPVVFAAVIRGGSQARSQTETMALAAPTIRELTGDRIAFEVVSVWDGEVSSCLCSPRRELSLTVPRGQPCCRSSIAAAVSGVRVLASCVHLSSDRGRLAWYSNGCTVPATFFGRGDLVTSVHTKVRPHLRLVGIHAGGASGPACEAAEGWVAAARWWNRW